MRGVGGWEDGRRERGEEWEEWEDGRNGRWEGSLLDGVRQDGCV